MTQEVKHTPGPWSYSDDSSHDCIWFTVGGPGDVQIANVCDDGFAVGEPEANARLIAAAPEGYELAELVLEWVDFSPEIIPSAKTLEIMTNKARVIIAKTRGQS